MTNGDSAPETNLPRNRQTPQASTESPGSRSDSIAHYDFELPKELIAQTPVANREDSRLMLVDRQRTHIDHYHFRDLDELLQPGDCLILNDTRVIPAKLVGRRASTHGRWQGLIIDTDPNGNWKLLAKTRGRIQVGEMVELEDRQGKPRLKLELLARLEDGAWVGRPTAVEEFGNYEVDRELTSDQWRDLVGRIPLPHYIRGGNMVDADVRDYQTIYAKKQGAVAAPTAGLHFTESLFQRVIDRGVNIGSVTLHVGIGTFRPVSAEQLNEHQMHAEFGSISEQTVNLIQRTKESGGRVIAVGTTTVRVLETAGRSGTLAPWEGETDIFIKPGFQFNVIDGLITNFHLPRSTLIVLVRTFGGDELMTAAYQHAIEEEYRFFSYGDAMLIV